MPTAKRTGKESGTKNAGGMKQPWGAIRSPKGVEDSEGGFMPYNETLHNTRIQPITNPNRRHKK